MADVKIPKAVISRLPRYYRFLGDLKSKKIERVSSSELSELMGATASQIRQDFNYFGGFGQQGYGYNVEYLYDEIEKIIGLDKINHIILIGAGNLGQALANYTNYRKRGFLIEAIFDKDPEKIGNEILGVKVLGMEELKEYLQNHKVDIATIAIPKEYAVQVVPVLVENGVRAIWNFAHVDLKVPDTVAVENVHLSESLMSLSYKAKELKD